MLRLLTCVGVLCALAAAGALSVAAQGAPHDRRAAARLAIPGRMLGPGVPVPIPPALLRERNGWLVSDGGTLVAVYAGTAGDNPSVGRLVIVRQDLVAGLQTVSTLDAGPTGALATVAAPLGSSVETSEQAGDIRIRAAGGRALRLNLGSGTVVDG